MARPFTKILFALALTVEPTFSAVSEDGLGDLQSATQENLAQLIKHKKWNEALVLLRENLDADPGHLSTLLETARVLWRLERHIEALSLLARRRVWAKGESLSQISDQIKSLISSFSSDANSINYQRALGLIDEEKYSEAERILEAALLRDPHNALLLVRLAQTKVLQGRPEGALDLIQSHPEALQFVPEARLWKGRALMLSGPRGKHGEASELLQKAHQELPNSELAVLWYAQTLSRTGKRKNAVELLQANAEANPVHVQALLELARLQPKAEAARTLRVALSRLDGYVEKFAEAEGPLGVRLGVSDVGTRIEKMLDSYSGKS